MIIAALFVIIKNWKRAITHQLVNELNVMWSVPAVDTFKTEGSIDSYYNMDEP